MDAKKNTHQREDAVRVLAKASSLVSAKGKKVVQVNLRKTELDDDQVLKLVLGPTGNLRAPTLLVGKKMVVGFNEQMYADLFGG